MTKHQNYWQCKVTKHTTGRQQVHSSWVPELRRRSYASSASDGEGGGVFITPDVLLRVLSRYESSENPTEWGHAYAKNAIYNATYLLRQTKISWAKWFRLDV